MLAYDESDILSNRTQSAGDSYDAINMLCQNHESVVLCPCSTEAAPLSVTVDIVDVVGTSRIKNGRIESHRDSNDETLTPQDDMALGDRSTGHFWSDSKRKIRFHSSGDCEVDTSESLPLQKLRMKVSSSVTYKICDVNPQGCSEDTWGFVTAEYVQKFCYASFYGAVEDQGYIRLFTQPLDDAEQSMA